MLERTLTRRRVHGILRNRTVAGDRVYRSRVTPPPRVPAINIMTPDEVATTERADNAVMLDDELTVRVEVVVAHEDEYEDKLDAILEQIDSLLIGNPDFVRYYERVVSRRMTVVFEEEGERQHGRAFYEIVLKFHEQPTPAGEFDTLTGVDLSDPNGLAPDVVAEPEQ